MSEVRVVFHFTVPEVMEMLKYK